MADDQIKAAAVGLTKDWSRLIKGGIKDPATRAARAGCAALRASPWLQLDKKTG